MEWTHLVLSGGGGVGMVYLGALYALRAKLMALTSIHGTSVGAVVGAMLCLGVDWDALLRFVVECPWDILLTPTRDQLDTAYFRGGVFDESTMLRVMRPLLGAVSLPPTCTLAQLHAHSRISLHIVAFDINSFTPLVISHVTHPDLSLITALAMSCAIPGLVAPIFLGDQCCIDGGVTSANNPIHQCLASLSGASADAPADVAVLNLRVESEPRLSAVLPGAQCVDMAWVFTCNALAHIARPTPISYDDARRVTTLICLTPEDPMAPATLSTLATTPAARAAWIEYGKSQAVLAF